VGRLSIVISPFLINWDTLSVPRVVGQGRIRCIVHFSACQLHHSCLTSQNLGPHYVSESILKTTILIIIIIIPSLWLTKSTSQAFLHLKLMLSLCQLDRGFPTLQMKVSKAAAQLIQLSILPY
jgi:hypothetical protein